MFADLFSIIVHRCCLVCLLDTLGPSLGRPIDTAFATSLVFNIGTPVLVFATLTELNIEYAAFGEIGFVALTALMLYPRWRFCDQNDWLVQLAVRHHADIG